MSAPDFGPPRVDEYRNAVLTRSVLRPEVRGLESRLRMALGRVPLRADILRYRVLGAVYADGSLVRESQRPAFADVSPDDPPALPSGAHVEQHLEGNWLYGGHWMGHFGHFLLETLSTLWPVCKPEHAGVVFHLWPSDDYAIEPLRWQRWLVDRAGWDLPLRIVRHQTVSVEKLLVPTRAYRLHEGALPAAVEVWDRIAPHRHATNAVFLSRSRLDSDNRRTDGDHLLDAAFAAAGYSVIHPQELPINEQVEIVAGARTLAGISGSQLHLSMFARSCQRVIEIGDPRLRDTPVTDQVRIAEARGHDHRFVPLLLSDGVRDVSATLARVVSLTL